MWGEQLLAVMLSMVSPMWEPDLALLALGIPEQGCLVGEQTSPPERSPAVLGPVPGATCPFPGQTTSRGQREGKGWSWILFLLL